MLSKIIHEAKGNLCTCVYVSLYPHPCYIFKIMRNSCGNFKTARSTAFLCFHSFFILVMLTYSCLFFVVVFSSRLLSQLNSRQWVKSVLTEGHKILLLFIWRYKLLDHKGPFFWSLLHAQACSGTWHFALEARHIGQTKPSFSLLGTTVNSLM